MTSPVSRLVRLFMLALMLFSVSWQPAAAQNSDMSVLRDSEAELLFKNASRPLIVAAGLDPNSVEVVLLSNPVMAVLVIPDDAPLNDWAGVAQRAIVLGAIFPARLALAHRLLRTDSRAAR